MKKKSANRTLKRSLDGSVFSRGGENSSSGSSEKNNIEKVPFLDAFRHLSFFDDKEDSTIIFPQGIRVIKKEVVNNRYVKLVESLNEEEFSYKIKRVPRHNYFMVTVNRSPPLYFDMIFHQDGKSWCAIREDSMNSSWTAIYDPDGIIITFAKPMTEHERQKKSIRRKRDLHNELLANAFDPDNFFDPESHFYIDKNFPDNSRANFKKMPMVWGQHMNTRRGKTRTRSKSKSKSKRVYRPKTI
jgi:hypothetical protein